MEKGILRLAALTAATVLIASPGSAGSFQRGPKKVIRDYGNGVTCFALSAQGMLFIAAKDASTIDVWDLQNFKKIGELSGRKAKVQSIAVSADGMFLAASFGDGSLHLWRTDTLEEAASFSAGGNKIATVALSWDAQLVAAASGEEAAQAWVWRRGNGEEPFLLDTPGTADGLLKESPRKLAHLAFSPDGQSLAGTTGDGILILWSLETGKYRKLFPQPGNLDTVGYSREGDLLASGTSVSISISSSEGKATSTPKAAQASVLYMPSGSEDEGHIGSADLLVYGAYWLADGKHILLYGEEVSPGMPFLRLVSLESLIRKNSLMGEDEVYLSSAQWFSKGAFSSQSGYFVQEAWSELVVWKLIF